MNAGLSNLFTLKSWLLTASMVPGTDYDAAILAIGKGVATQLEKYCNRKFARVEGDVFECGADRMHVGLPRFPLEEITLIEQRDTLADGWGVQAIPDVVDNQDNYSGLVWFGAMPGIYPSRLRFTYTGGYWWNQQEPDYVPPVSPTEENPDLSLMPAGAAALPADVLQAWLLLCESVWKTHDKLGLSIGEKAGSGGGALLGLSLPGLDIPPIVQKQLQPFIRYSLTT